MIKMYSLVLRHLSGIQKGIQTAHAIVDFGQKFGKTKEWKQWADKDKVLIVLEVYSDTQLDELYEDLRGRMKWPVMKFKEPDLGNVTTAVCFLQDIADSNWFTSKFSLASN